MEEMIKSEVAKLKNEINSQIDLANKKAEEGSRGEIESLKSSIEGKITELLSKTAKGEKELKATQAELQRLKNEGAGREAGKMTLAGAIVKSMKAAEAEIKQFAETKSGFTIDTKSADIMTTVAGTVDNPFDPAIRGKVNRQTRLRSFMTVAPMTGNSYTFVREASNNNNAAFIVEGAEKPLSDNVLAPVEAPARKVAHHKRISEENLNDIPALSAFLATQSTEELFDKEDLMIFSGANNTAPNFKGFSISALKAAQIPASFETTSPNKFDAILAGLATLAARNYIADTVIVNPVDYFQMLSIKNTVNYLSPITFTGGQAFLAGYALEMSTAIPIGTFTVANFNRGAALLQRDPLSIRFYDQDRDNAIKNLVTVVLEERIAMPIYYEDMFFVDTYANVITGITP